MEGAGRCAAPIVGWARTDLLEYLQEDYLSHYIRTGQMAKYNQERIPHVRFKTCNLLAILAL